MKKYYIFLLLTVLLVQKGFTQFTEYPNEVLFNWAHPYDSYEFEGQHFRIKYPNDFDSLNGTKKYPVILFLHGYGERGTDNENQLKHGGQRTLNAITNGDFPGMAVYPQTTGNSWDGGNLEAVIDLLDELIAKCQADPDRIYVHGLSLGAEGVWRFAFQYPQYAAAIFPMSGVVGGNNSGVTKFIPTWLSQGGRDNNPTPATGNNRVIAWRSEGANIRYSYMPTTGHGTWNAQYSKSEFFPWFLDKHKTDITVLYGQSSFCEGDPIDITLGVTAGFADYQWVKNDTTSTNFIATGAGSNTINVTSTGNYYVRFQRANGVWTRWSKPVNVNRNLGGAAKPTTSIGNQSLNLPTIAGQQSVELTGPQGLDFYRWLKDGSIISGANNASYTTSAAGEYAISVRTAQESGYQDEAETIPSEFPAPPQPCFSDPSEPLTVTTENGLNVPAKPTNFSANLLNDNSIIINWDDNSTNELAFELYRSVQSGTGYSLIQRIDGGSGSNPQSYVDSPLDASTNYFYRMRAVNNSGGSGYTNEMSASTFVDVEAPSAPVLNLIGSSTNSVSISWTSSADNVGVVGYDVFRNNALVASLSSSQLQFTNTGLAIDQTYNYVVKAKDAVGNISLPSNQVTAKTSVSQGLKYSYYHHGNFSSVDQIEPEGSLIRTGIVNNFDINIRDRDTRFAFIYEGLVEIPTAGEYTFYTNSDDGSKLYINNELIVDNDGTHGCQQRSGTITLAAGLAAIRVPMFENGGGECLQVRWQGPGISKQYIPDNRLFNNSFELSGFPNQPSNLQATVVSNNELDLSWEDNSNDEDNFEIYRSLNQNSNYQLVHLAAANELSWSDSNLSGNTTYYYKIKAINSNGGSSFSGPISATTAANPPAPSVPTNFGLLVENSSSVRLNWTDNATTEQGYELYRSTSSVSSTFTLITTTAPDVATYLDEQTGGNSTYYYRIRAKGDGNFSDFTPTLNVTTDNNAPEIEPIINRSVKFGTTLELPVVANDPDGDPIEFSFTTALPAFMTFTDNDYGTGQLTVNSNSEDADQYTIEITADDGSGGTDTESFVITISDNDNPDITPIADVSITEGLSQTVNVDASDETMNSLVLTASNLPDFVTFADDGLGVGTFAINPDINQNGVYNNIKLLANDGNGGFSEFNFNIIVNVAKRNFSAFVNFGSNTAPSPWNNITSGGGAKDDRLILSNDNEEDIRFINLGQWYNSAASSPINSSLYITEVVESYIRNSFGTSNFTLSELNPSLSYDLTFYAGAVGTSFDNTSITINGVNQQLNPNDNTDNTLVFTNQKPDGNGNLAVSVNGSPDNNFIMNSMVIDVYYEDGLPPDAPTNLTLSAVSNSELALSWDDNSNNEQSFEIYRSDVSDMGPFTEVGSVLFNQNTFTDENLTGNTTYYYKVRAVNSTGSAETQVAFETTLNSAPVLTSIQNVIMSVGDTVSIALSATDAEADAINISAVSLPSFVELADNSDGTGLLTLIPTAGDEGFYGTNTIEATDVYGLSSQVSFNIQVVDSDFANTVYLNLDNSSNATSPWNNVSGNLTAGAIYDSFQDFNGVASSINLELGSGWESAGFDGLSSGNDSYLFEDAVFQSYWRSSSSSASLLLNGLDPAKTYTIELLGSSSQWLNTETNYTVGSKTRTNINVTQNDSNLLSFSGIVPDQNGDVSITLNTYNQYTEAMFLNAIVVKSNIDGGTPLTPSKLEVKSDSKTEIELSWQDNAVNETGYEIYVTDEIGKAFSFLASVPADAESYVHTGLSPNTARIYKVRAISSNGNSEFTSEKAAVTINNKIFINFNTDISGYLQAAAPWNNTNKVPTTGLVFDNFIDFDSNPVPVELYIEDIGDGSNNRNGPVTGNSIYPDAVMQAYYYFEPNAAPGIFRLSNLSEDMAYDLTFLGSHGNGLQVITDYTVGDQTVTVFGKNNRFRTATIQDVFPEADNSILFEADASNSNQAAYGFMNSLVIQEHLSAEVALDKISPSVPQNLVADNITENSLDLLWNTATDNISLSEYEVFQNGELVASTKETTLNVTNLLPDYEYIFTVRSVDRNNNRSGFSSDLIASTTESAEAVTDYFSRPTGDLNSLSTWNSMVDGTGSSPADFTSDNQQFNLNRNAILTNAWTISGISSKLVVSTNTDLTIDADFSGTISAMDNAQVLINVDATPEFVEMAPSSLVAFNSSTNTIPAAKFGNLNLGGNLGAVKQFSAGNVTVEGVLTVVDGIALNGFDPNSTNIIAKGSVSFHGIGDGTPSAEMLSLIMAGTGEQEIQTFGDNINLFALEVRQGSDVVFNTNNPNLEVNVGNSSGGGLVIEDGASLSIGNHTLTVNGRGTINAENQLGKIRTNNGILEIHSASTLTSHLYFESGSDTLNSMVADMVNMGKIQINSSVHISKELEIIDGIVDSKGNITMVSDASGTAYISEIQNRGAIEGAINTQRYVAPPSSRLYRYYGSMVQNATVADWQDNIAITGGFPGSSTGPGLGSGASVFYYDELQAVKWVAYPSASNQEIMEAGKGFAVYTRDLVNPLTLELTGEAVQGDFDFTLTPGTGDPGANGGEGDGWNLIANPYQSPIQWGTTGWDSQNVGGIVSIWDADYSGGGKYFYAGAGVNDDLFDGEIAIGQGFWVQAIGSDPQLRISESAKVKFNDTDFYRNSMSEEPTLVVTLAQGDLEDKAFIKYSNNGSKTYDPSVHGRKRANAIFNVSSASKDGVDLAINQLPTEFCKDSIALLTSNMSTGNYSLSFERLESFQDGELFTLVDHYEETEIVITPSTSYDFEVITNAGPSAVNRFSLIIEKPEIVQDLNISQSRKVVCEELDQVVVNLEATQKEVVYTLMLNGIDQNMQIVGNGGEINFEVNAEELRFGNNTISFAAGFSNCKVELLNDFVEVEKVRLPEVNSVPPVTICKGSSAIVSVDPSQENLSYRWYSNEYDDTPILESSKTTFETPVLNSSTTYYYAAVNANGCESEARESVTILMDSLITSVQFHSSASDICEGDEEIIVDLLTSQVDVTYGLLINGERLAEKIGTGSELSFELATTDLNYGENHVQIEAHSKHCSSELVTETQTINLTELPTVEQVDPVSICAGERALIEVINAPEGVTYRWYTTQTEEDFIYESDSAFFETEVLYDSVNFFYTTINANGCESRDRQEVLVAVEDLEKPIITLEGELLISSSETGNQWFFNGDPIENATNSQFLVSDMGEYSVSVSKGACEVYSDSFEYQVSSNSERKVLELVVYPNPADREFNIGFNQVLEESVDVRVIDLTGREVYSTIINVGSNEQVLKVNDLASGSYIIQVLYQKRTFIERLVVK